MKSDDDLRIRRSKEMAQTIRNYKTEHRHRPFVSSFPSTSLRTLSLLKCFTRT